MVNLRDLARPMEVAQGPNGARELERHCRFVLEPHLRG